MPSQCRRPFSFTGHVRRRRLELSAALPSTPPAPFHPVPNNRQYKALHARRLALYSEGHGSAVRPLLQVIQLIHPSTLSRHPRPHLSSKTQIQRRPSIVGSAESVWPSKALLTVPVLHESFHQSLCRGMRASDIWRVVNALLMQL